MPNDHYDRQFDPAYEPMNQTSFTAGARRQSNIRVVSLLITPTGEYNQQVMRPWITDYNHRNMNAVYEAVGRSLHNFRQMKDAGKIDPRQRYMITPETLSQASNTFIQPSGEWESHVHLNNKGNWNNQVCRFMMAIEILEGQTIAPRQYVLIGHTDRMGLRPDMFGAATGSIDHDMEFTINTMYETRETLSGGNYGQRERTLVACNQILVNDYYKGPGELPSTVHRMRPMDVVNSIHLSSIPELMNRNVTVTDSRSVNTTIPAKSRVENANPNTYMSQILSGLTQGKEQANALNRRGDAFELAAQQVQEGSHHRDPFLTAISEFNAGAGTNKFRFRDLLRMDPNAERDEITTIQWREQPRMVGQCKPGQDMHIAGETNNWTDNTRSAQLATLIANMLPSMMTPLAVRRCEIYASNKHVTHLNPEPFIGISGLDGMLPGTSVRNHGPVLEMQVKQQIISQLLDDGRYEISVTCDLMGEVWISLDLEFEGKSDFVVPAYASALTSPVVTRNVNNLIKLAGEFNTLQTEVFPQQQAAPQRSSTQYFTPPQNRSVPSEAPAQAPRGNPYQTIS